jgi:hypothetical protein
VVDTIKLYISAANELQLERDLISRIVTEIPVTLGWQINLTPFGEKTLEEKLVLDANLHILILGIDIRAPIGFELYLSRRVGRNPVLFLKGGINRTPAAVNFYRSISEVGKWHTFDDLGDLRYQALEHISRYIINRSDFFSLKSVEMNQLSDFLKDLEKSTPEQIEDVQGVAGENSVILSRERFTPKGGVLIQSPEERESGNSK